jgi:hypothetical protein
VRANGVCATGEWGILGRRPARQLIQYGNGIRVADDIEVHFEPKQGALYLACGDEAFARLRDAVVEEAGSEIIGDFPTEIRDIAIHKVQSAPTSSRLVGSFAFIGCAIVGFVILSVLMIGVGTIIKWFG